MMRYKRFEDINMKMALRYILYGLIPSGAIIFYSKMVVGDSKLMEYNPDLFQPQVHEYYKNPITRFLAKYVKEDPEVTYYRNIAKIERKHQLAQQQSIMSQAQSLQQIRKRGYMYLREKAVVENIYDRQVIDEYTRKHGLDGKGPAGISEQQIDDEVPFTNEDVETMDLTALPETAAE